jgi:hypothetical protein
MQLIILVFDANKSNQPRLPRQKLLHHPMFYLFVFNGKRYPRPIIRLVKFDYISLVDEIQLLKAFGIAGSLGH